MVLRGKWAQGIEPRNFTWILQGKLAVCERPGGYGGNHRKVRRQEEIIWLREQGFTMIVSLAVSPHNLHNYDEMGMPWRHRPFTRSDDQEAFLARLFPELRQLLLEGGKLVLHQDELGDRLSGLMAAYVLWNNLVPGGPQAISVVEQLLHRQLGPDARSLVALVPRLPAPGTTTVAVDQPDPLPAVDPDEVG
jgi:hypothetical protein